MRIVQFCILFLFLVNGSQVLQVNPGCLKCVSGMNLSLANLLCGNFTNILNYAYITPVFKKYDTTDKNNYKTISTLSHFPKVFEKLIHTQINSFMEPNTNTSVKTIILNTPF